MAFWKTTLPWILGLSILMFVVSIVVAGFIIVRMPADYLVRKEAMEWRFLKDRPLLGSIVWFLKNSVGLLMLLAGVIMLLTPGQGLLFIFLGLTLLDFPGKRKFLHQFLRRPGVLNSINRLRERFGQVALEQTADDSTEP